MLAFLRNLQNAIFQGLKFVFEVFGILEGLGKFVLSGTKFLLMT